MAAPMGTAEKGGLFPIFEQMELFAGQLPDVRFPELLDKWVFWSGVELTALSRKPCTSLEGKLSLKKIDPTFLITEANDGIGEANRLVTCRL